MTHIIPDCEPRSLTAGDSWEWDRSLPKFPPSAGWALAYTITGPGDKVTVTAATSSEGDRFEVREDADAHASQPAGEYVMTGKASKGAARYTVYGPHPVTILPNVEAVTGASLSELEQELADLKAVRDANPGTGGIAEMTIAGRTVKYRTMDEVNRRIGVLENALRYARSVSRSRGALPPGILIRFADA